MKPAMRQPNFQSSAAGAGSWTIVTSISDPSPDFLELLDHFHFALANEHRSPITWDPVEDGRRSVGNNGGLLDVNVQELHNIRFMFLRKLMEWRLRAGS